MKIRSFARRFLLLPGIAIVLTGGDHPVAIGQNHAINTELSARLDSIGREDQRYRRQINDLSHASADSLAIAYRIPVDSVYSNLTRKQLAIDQTNLSMIEGIIRKFGYPGKAMVGYPANEVAFYVIQHSTKVAQFLPLLKQAAVKDDISYALIAMMEDRYFTEQEKDQIYGTQLWGNAVKRQHQRCNKTCILLQSHTGCCRRK